MDAVNERTESNERSLVRKAMVLCGLSKDFDGVRKREQLSSELQRIIYAYPANHEGEVPVPPTQTNSYRVFFLHVCNRR